MNYGKGYFEPQQYRTNMLDDTAASLQITVGANTYDGVGEMPQATIEVYKGVENKITFWIDLDKIDEVITALAWAKHRMEEETRGKDSSE